MEKQDQQLRQRLYAKSEPSRDSDDDKLAKLNKRRGSPIPRGTQWIAILLTLIALWTRLYKINWSDFVVWDEAHFGKFAGYYIKRTFYFDVHPPLGKMLNGFAGMLAGFNGAFEFASGAKYPAELKYGVIRFVNGVFGAMMVPLAYYTGIHLRLSEPGAVLLATLVIVDNAICTISRFILLDSMLLFMTALATYTLCVFRNYQNHSPFSPEWYLWLAFSGISLGLVVSVKWVGLFAIALIGLHTLDDLWEMLGNLKLPPVKSYVLHWVWRAVFLILVPVMIYVLVFVMHFAILNRSGPGDAQMSSLFQSGLVGNDFTSNPLELAYGSKVSLKNNVRGGGLLHSHIQKYPGGSEQQQVTCYHHKDSNNDWVIQKPWGESSKGDLVEYVKDGDTIRLSHASTNKNLHSHNVPAPISPTEYEVSGYGNETNGDMNDHWVVERVTDWTLSTQNDRIRSLTTQFRLRHKTLGCLLRSSRSLPEWGFKQIEVICQKKADRESDSNMWNIEQHSHPKMPPGGKGAFKTSFLRNFLDINVGMWNSNNALVPDPDKEPDQLVSQPYHWPFMLRGLRMCGWGDHEVKFYLLGNPAIWWGSTVALVLLTLLMGIYIIRQKRGNHDFSSFDEYDDFYFAFKVSVAGWFLHYIPFYIMGRVMYVHHYFPALYFAIIALAYLIDHFASKLRKPFRWLVFLVAYSVFIGVFLYFADITFGMKGPASNWEKLRWLKSWNIS